MKYLKINDNCEKFENENVICSSFYGALEVFIKPNQNKEYTTNIYRRLITKPKKDN